MLYNILLAFMILVCILMVLVILAQGSEGGALGMGGGPSGFMTARGAGNFLTRTTWILAGLFFGCAVLLIIVGNHERNADALNRLNLPPASTLRTPGHPATGALGGGLGATGANGAAANPGA